jgi:hypothetical protein
VTGLAMSERRKDGTGKGSEFERRRRGRNLALLALLVGFVVVVYAVTIVKWVAISGG